MNQGKNRVDIREIQGTIGRTASLTWQTPCFDVRAFTYGWVRVVDMHAFRFRVVCW